MRLGSRLVAVLTPIVLAGGLLTATPSSGAPPRPTPAADRIGLPAGFQPEGIAIAGGTAYFGSLADGSIYAADLVTGEGRRLRPGPGVPAVGLKADDGRLYVAGGPTGTARVVDAATGRVLRTLQLTRREAFVNDVVIARGAAWFTDSAAARLYRVPLAGRGDGLPRTADVTTVRLRGAWRQPDAGEFGANGIALTPDRRALLVVNSTSGRLFRVEMRGARRGVAEGVRVRGSRLTTGDGMLLAGDRLHVVRNRLNQLVTLRLTDDGRRAGLDARLRSTDFDVPTTVARYRNRLYLPNARFGTTPRPGTRYSAYGFLDPTLQAP